MLGNDSENRNCGCNNNNNNCALCNQINTASNNPGCNCNNVGCSNNNMMNYDCDYSPEGMNAAFGYNTATELANDTNCACSQDPEGCCADRRRVREEMIHQIKCLNFAIIELGLYLDTHPNDQKALCLHREYVKQLKELKDQYQRIYGPLSIYFPCNKWRWLEEPWPWEGGNC